MGCCGNGKTCPLCDDRMVQVAGGYRWSDDRCGYFEPARSEIMSPTEVWKIGEDAGH